MDEKVEELIAKTVARIDNCYHAHRLCCSESITVVVNRAFGGGLDDRAALQLGAGFCHGMGGAGCSCGALSGSVALLGLFLGPHVEGGMSKKAFRAVVKEMHDQFRSRFLATCCRILSKKGKGEDGKRRFSCRELTMGGGELCIRLLLQARPHLQDVADLNFLEGTDHPL